MGKGFRTLFHFDGLWIAQHAFIVIAVLIACIVYGLSGAGAETIFESPVLTVQSLLIFSYPFCYLILKNIRKNAVSEPDDQRLPLWIFLLLQISSVNILLILLCLSGILQMYGKTFFTLSAFRITARNRTMVLSMIPLVLLYGLILFVRIRLGMIFDI